MFLNKRFSIYKNKKVLITGHNGFVGSWLTASLLKLESKVFGISLKNQNRAFKFIVNKKDPNLVEFIQDINDFEKLNLIIKKIKPNFIFHLAAQPIVKIGYEQPLNTFKTNILGTSNVLNSILKNKIKNSIIVTSDKVYLNKENKKFFKENSEIGGDDIYSSSKACTEIVTRSFFLSFRDKFNQLDTVRAGNIIGGGDFGTSRLLPDIFNSIHLKRTLNIRSPYSIRPWQNVLDVINAYLLLPVYQKKRIKKFDFWNVGPDKKESNIRVIDIVNKLKKINSSIKIKINIKKKSFKESQFLFLENDKIKKIGWKNKRSINGSLFEASKWYELYYKSKNQELIQFTSQLISKNLS